MNTGEYRVPFGIAMNDALAGEMVTGVRSAGGGHGGGAAALTETVALTCDVREGQMVFADEVVLYDPDDEVGAGDDDEDEWDE